MIDDVEIPTPGDQPQAPTPLDAPGRGRAGRRGRSGGNGRNGASYGSAGGARNGRGGRGPRGPRVPWRWRRRLRRPGKPRVKKLRLLLILTGLAILAVISTVFGMMMAVASDLPQIENRQEYRIAANSYLYDDHWHLIGLFASPTQEVIDRFDQISWAMRRAIVSVEDRRFWSDPGVDLRGIARAVVADVTGHSRQGGSTIAQQFVKNALAAQNNRTVFEKLREAALAYHLTRRWSREKILQEYLNSIYFGNGAYGVESAARVYFGKAHGYNSSATPGQTATGCGDAPRPPCASMLTVPEAALLAGMVADPSAFDPLVHPQAAIGRRAVVLKDMLEAHDITRAQYVEWSAAPIPTQADIQQPHEPPAAPYFTSWLRPQILSAMGYHHPGVPDNVAEYRAFYGGLKIRTTLDLSLQQAADQAISQELPTGEGLPSASLVAIDNKTGEVRAMVGGPIVNGQEDYRQYPFNLASEAERQPGSSFKPFTLAMALKSGEYGPDSIIDSAPQNFIVPNSGGKEHFIVHNFGNTYSGPITLAAATAISDNSVYAQVGIHVGTKRIAKFARSAGIRTPVSHNYAMILGGLKVGVSPLDMAHAYETFAEGGRRVNPSLGARDGPSGIAQIYCPKICPQHILLDHPEYQRVLPAPIAQEVHDLLTGVVQHGTGTAATISGVDVAGKTGTTTNYADAWFVGWTPQMTTAVWVGYPNKLVPMTTAYNGQPVEGGTYPAIIWHNFMVQALQILATENPSKSNSSSSAGSLTGTTGAAPSSSGSGVSTSATSTTGGTAAGGGNTGGATQNGGTGAGGQTGGGGGTAGGGTAGGGTTGAGGQTGVGGGTVGGGTAGGGTTGAGGGTGGGGGGTGGAGTGSGGAGIGGGG